MTALPPGYHDPSPEQVAAAEAVAAGYALSAWTSAMLAAIGLGDVDVPLDDPDVVARLGPAMPGWLAEATARVQARVVLGGLPVAEGG